MAAKWKRMCLDTLEDVDGDLRGGSQVGTAGERKSELQASEVAVAEPAQKKPRVEDTSASPDEEDLALFNLVGKSCASMAGQEDPVEAALKSFRRLAC